MARESERERERERDRHRAGERSHDQERRRRKRKSKHAASSSQSGSRLLSADALAQLDHLNQHGPIRAEERTPKKTRRKRPREYDDDRERVLVTEKTRKQHKRRTYNDETEVVVEKSRREHKRKSRRAVSGVLLEEGDGRTLRGIRGGERDRYDRYEKEVYEEPPNKKRKCTLFLDAW